MSSKVYVRDAHLEDCEDIIKMLQEMGDYHNLPDCMNIDHNDLIRDAFGENRLCNLLVAVMEPEYPGAPTTYAGYATYLFMYPMGQKAMYIEDVFASPKFRSNGVGSKLFKKLIERGVEAGVKQVRFLTADWNTLALGFYFRKGAKDASQNGYRCYSMKPKVKPTSSLPRDVVIRDGTTLDDDTVSKIHQQLRISNGIVNNSYGALIERSHSSDPRRCTIVAEDFNGGILGCSTFTYGYSTWDGKTVMIDSLFAYDHQQKDEVEKALWQTVIQKALSKGFHKLDFIVKSGPKSAVAGFESQNVTDVTETEGWLPLMMSEESIIKCFRKTQELDCKPIVKTSFVTNRHETINYPIQAL